MKDFTHTPVIRSGKMSFHLPDSNKEEGDDVFLIFKKHQCPLVAFGVDLLMDFILDGKDEQGRNIIIMTKISKFDSFVSVMN